uniref:Uncharacterized protein n=1 Tax=Oryza punctata TaxID=4537 RepID=A0A0E0LQT3_ORYPU
MLMAGTSHYLSAPGRHNSRRNRKVLLYLIAHWGLILALISAGTVDKCPDTKWNSTTIKHVAIW